MQALAVDHSRKARVVEMRFFDGLSVEETAHVLDVSQDTVTRDWKFANAWLLREMTAGQEETPPDRWKSSAGRGMFGTRVLP